MLKILPKVKMLKEKKLKEEALEPYMRSFIQLLGLPYIHTIEEQSLANKPLIMDNVNQHWHYYKPCPTQSDILEAR